MTLRKLRFFSTSRDRAPPRNVCAVKRKSDCSHRSLYARRVHQHLSTERRQIQLGSFLILGQLQGRSELSARRPGHCFVLGSSLRVAWWLKDDRHAPISASRAHHHRRRGLCRDRWFPFIGWPSAGDDDAVALAQPRTGVRARGLGPGPRIAPSPPLSARNGYFAPPSPWDAPSGLHRPDRPLTAPPGTCGLIRGSSVTDRLRLIA